MLNLSYSRNLGGDVVDNFYLSGMTESVGLWIQRTSVLHRITQSRQLLLLLAYGAYMVVPLVHGRAEVLPRCDVCQAAQRMGPVLRADCNGPCHDPKHHHHHGSTHDSDHCVVCQSHAASHLSDWASGIDLGTANPVSQISNSRIVPSSPDRFWLEAPRGPPILTVTL